MKPESLTPYLTEPIQATRAGDEVVIDQQPTNNKEQKPYDTESQGSRLSHRSSAKTKGISLIGFYCTDSQKTRDEFDDDYCCYCIRLGKEPTPDSYYRDWYDSQAPIPR